MVVDRRAVNPIGINPRRVREWPNTATTISELDLRWWAAANYLTVAQIYLQFNPLLREPLTADQIKPRLLGHWGTSPGLSMIYTLLNRLIRRTDRDWIYVTGPGHGGPALLANTYLEGTYSEVYPSVSSDADGLLRLIRQFSTPGGVPSHVSVQTPGSIHEGGELGYALAHAAGAVFDHPELNVACVIGDGEAETGPLAASWKLPSFLNPRRDGAVLPILHLNGYKISGPTVLGRAADADVIALLASQGLGPGDRQRRRPAGRVRRVVRGARRRPRANRRDPGRGAIRRRGADAGTRVAGDHPAHPEGLDRPRHRRRHPGRGHLPRPPGATAARCARTPITCVVSSNGCTSYEPERQFDADGRLVPELRALAPSGDKRMSASPYANGGRLLKDLPASVLTDHALSIDVPGQLSYENTRPLGAMLRELYRATTHSTDGGGTFRLFCPDETASNRLQDVFDVTDRCLIAPVLETDDHLSADGRVMEVLSEHLCQGWLEGYLLSGRHGLFATYEAFAMVSASMLVQHTKWLQHATELPWRDIGRVAQRAADLDLLAQRSQRLLAPGSGADRHRDSAGARSRAGVAAAGRELHALDRQSLFHQPRSRQSDRRRQAVASAVPVAR